MPVDAVVIGAGGHAREVAEILSAEGRYRMLGFLADTPPPAGNPASERYLGPIDRLPDLTPHYALGVGDSVARARVAARLGELGGVPVCAIHPDSTLGTNVELGDGTIVFPGARLTTEIQLGCHCHVNVNASVSHDVHLGDFVTLSPGSVVCGTVTLGDCCYVGANACIIQNLTVGNGVTIGAGAVVTSALPDPGVYVGCPARLLTAG